LVTFFVLFFAFKDSFGSSIPQYPLYLVIGIVIFNTVQELLTDSAKKIFENRFLLKSINFPASTLILALCVRVIFSQIPILFLVILVAVFSSVSWLSLALLYPLVLLMVLLLSLGASVVCSILGVYIADLGNAIAFSMRLLWLATPLFYNLDQKSGFLKMINFFNPFYYLLHFSRELLVFQRFSGPQFLLLVLLSGATFALSIFIWKHYYQKVVERI